MRADVSIRSGNDATCSKVWRAIAASVSPSSWRAVVAGGASDGSDGKATGCAEGCAPRNGGGVLVWKATSPLLRSSFGDAHGRRRRVADFLQSLLQQIQRGGGRRARPAARCQAISPAAARRACGKRISGASESGARDGASGGAAAAARRHPSEPRSAGRGATSDDSSVWRSTISAALRSGMPAGGDPERQRSLEKQPGLLKGILDLAAGQVLIEAGPLRQQLQHRLLQLRRQGIRAGRQRRHWQTAAPGCPAGWRRSAPPWKPPASRAASIGSSATLKSSGN